MSPQFYVMFDDTFSTVPYMAANEVPPNWSLLVQKSELASLEDYDLAKTWIEPQENPEVFLSNQEVGGVLDEAFTRDKFRKCKASQKQKSPHVQREHQ